MSNAVPTLGQAIDEIIAALEPLEMTSRRTAISAVCAHLQVDLASDRPGVPPLPTSLPLVTPPTSPVRALAQMDIRSLKEEKKPKNARQMACLVAYYLQELAPEADRKETVSTTEIEKYFKQAGFKLPQQIQQLLVDSKAAGYFDSPARGAYKLNAVGYNLIAHGLPEANA